MKKYFKQLKANKKGFTLIEMIVVIAIIGILAAILVPSMAGYLSNARDSKEEANAKTIYTAAQAAVTSLETGTTSVKTGEYVAAINGIGDDSKVSQNITPADTDTNKVGSNLFEKIESLLGTSNYVKFSEIKVNVVDGAVESVTVTAIGDTAADAITYPAN